MDCSNSVVDTDENNNTKYTTTTLFDKISGMYYITMMTNHYNMAISNVYILIWKLLFIVCLSFKKIRRRKTH